MSIKRYYNLGKEILDLYFHIVDVKNCHDKRKITKNIKVIRELSKKKYK